MKTAIKELQTHVFQALENFGYSQDEAKIIGGVLLWAQLRGNDQGIVKLAGDGIPRRQDDGPVTVVKESPATALVDGNKNHAMLTLDFATDLAIEKAKTCGVSVVGNFNSDESTGALGYYVEKFAKAGLIGVAYASAPFKSAAPHGSIDPMFCTNPIAYGIPTDGAPIILDFATSQATYYGLIEAKIAGEAVPSGLGYDADGNDTTDPAKMLEGAIKVFGGHKGSGLALIVQILAGPMVGAAFFDTGNDNAGNVVFGINPEFFAGKDAMAAQTSDMVNQIKASRKVSGVSKILMPGERSYNHYRDAIASGEIEVEDGLWQELCAKAK